MSEINVDQIFAEILAADVHDENYEAYNKFGDAWNVFRLNDKHGDAERIVENVKKAVSGAQQ